MSRLLLALCVGAHLTLGGPAVLTAQDGNYDENALRLEGHNGDVRIVRGAQGTVLARISGFRTTDVAKLVAPSEQAMAEARIFSHDYIPGSWIAGLGIASVHRGPGPWSASTTVIVTLLGTLSRRPSLTINSNTSAAPAGPTCGATKVAVTVDGSDNAAAGPLTWRQRYVNGSPSGSLLPDPSSVTSAPSFFV